MCWFYYKWSRQCLVVESAFTLWCFNIFLSPFPSFVAHVLLANNTSSRITTVFLYCMPSLISVFYDTYVLLNNNASSITVFLYCMPTLRFFLSKLFACSKIQQQILHAKKSFVDLLLDRQLFNTQSYCVLLLSLLMCHCAPFPLLTITLLSFGLERI